MGDTIYIARHGTSELNAAGRVSGQMDTALAEAGRRQAAALAEVLQDVPLVAVYASDLRRSYETAAPTAAAHSLPVVRLPQLNEMSHGIAEGRYRDHRDRSVAELWQQRKNDPVGFAMPGGESFTDLCVRVEERFERILESHPRGSVLIVGHRNVNRVILSRLLSWTLEEAVSAKVRNKYAYAFCRDSRQIQTIALTDHKLGRTYDGFRT